MICGRHYGGIYGGGEVTLRLGHSAFLFDHSKSRFCTRAFTFAVSIRSRTTQTGAIVLVLVVLLYP